MLEAGDDDGRQAHDRAVAGAGRALRGAGNALFALEGEQCGAHLATNVETHVRRRTVPVLEPAHVSVHHVERVVTTHRQQRIRQAQRHRRVVRPLAGLELEGASSNHARPPGLPARRAREKENQSFPQCATVALMRGPPPVPAVRRCRSTVVQADTAARYSRSQSSSSPRALRSRKSSRLPVSDGEFRDSVILSAAPPRK